MRAILAGALVLAGCGNGDFDHLGFDPLGPAPAGVELQPGVSIPVGVSVATTVTAFDTDGDQMVCDLALVAREPGILLVERATSGPVVMTGVSPGVTAIVVYCDGDVLGTVSGEVKDGS